MTPIEVAEGVENGVPTTQREISWRLGETFVLRLAGFPIGPLLALGAERSFQAGQHEREANWESSLAVELRDKRRHLRAVASDEKFREAVFLSNPDCYDRVNAYLEHAQDEALNSSLRRVERLITVYLQRFSAKNETVSFFGPVSFGTFGGSAIAISRDEVLSSDSRCVRLAHWAAEAIASAGYESPVLLPGYNWAPLQHLHPERITPDISHLLEMLDEFCLATLRERVRLLKDMETVFTGLTGTAALRNQGQSYGDRMILCEDRHYNGARFTIGAPIAKKLTSEYSRIINLVTMPDRLRFDAMRRVFREFFCEEWGENKTIPYLEVADRLSKRPSDRVAIRDRAHNAWIKSIQPFFEVLDRTLTNRTIPGRAVLTSADVDALTNVLPATDPWPCVVSPDILIGGKNLDEINAGHYDLILGELHSGFGTNGFYACVHPDKVSFAQELITLYEAAAQGREPVRTTSQIFNKTFVDLELPFRTINLGGCATARDVVLDLSELQISAGTDHLELHEQQSLRPLFLCSKIPQILGLYPLQLFAFPSCSVDPIRQYLLKRNRYIPRLTYDRFTFVRETWQEPREHLLALLQGPDISALTSLNQYADRQLWPRCVYIRPDAGEKPLFIDRYNPYLLLDLRRRLTKSSGLFLEVSEMLPGPDDLWLTDLDGAHTCELRMTFVATAGAA